MQQITQAEFENTTRVEVEEQVINFRPSPNFKNMKKFLKSRSDYPELTLLAQMEHHAEKEVKPILQPPLPSYPPPPDSPPNLKIVIKKEKEDVETNSNPGEDTSDGQELNHSTTEQISEDGSKEEICKQFIRGECTRPICKYAHKMDVSQLRGVYTFCWNYQNKGCKYPNCKYVHASVFEEAEFLRTGILPAHARSHLKKVAPPPPPPPEEQATEVEIPATFSNPPPSVTPIVGNATPIATVVPAPAMEARPVEEDYRAVQRSVSPLKREWSDVEKFSSSPCDHEPIEHLAKKCKNCDLSEFRLKYNKEIFDNVLLTSDELERKMVHLQKKTKVLNEILMTLLKQAFSPHIKPSLGNGLLSNEKDKSIADQLYHYLTASNRINEDTAKNMYGGSLNLPSLMAKLLGKPAEQMIHSDLASSRET